MPERSAARRAGISWSARALLLALAARGLCAALDPSTANATPASLTLDYSPYERQAIADAEQELGTRVDPSPEGKAIERIDFVRLDPIDRHDPLPMALDLVHATTRASVLRRELLVSEGSRWEKALVDESARNLRALSQLSLVLCVPMRGSVAGRVRLVVITKDVWSLYVDFDFEGTLDGLSSLTLQPKESNVAGLNHTAMGQFILQPLSYSVGARYEVPRVDGRLLSLAVEGNVVVNRSTGNVEGTFGTATIDRPLFSSMTEWAGGADFAWNDQVLRVYENTAVKAFEGAIPWQYRERTLTEILHLTRSFGWEIKNDLSAGVSLSHARYSVPNSAGLDPAKLNDFAWSVVPIGEDRVGPFVQWHGYTSNFLRILDVDTLGLQEDERLGHEGWLRLYPVLRALGSTRDLLGLYGALAYTAALGDGFVRATAETTVEAQPDRVTDGSADGALSVVTPRTGVGRLVFAAFAQNRWQNYLRGISYLGGDTRLRGYPTNEFAGKDLLSANLEYRSRPVVVASIQLGVAAFYDVGDAFDGYDHLRPKQSVGVGFRAVLPQIERAVFRFDVGFPVGPNVPPNVAPIAAVFAFHQAVSIPGVGAGLGP